MTHATSLGFHYLGLSYPHSPAVASFCTATDARAADASCAGRLRDLRLNGGTYDNSTACAGGASSGCVVSAGVSGLAQLRDVLQRAAADPRGVARGWAAFVDNNSSSAQPRWQNIVVTGESQGSGMALMVGKAHRVARVAQLAGVDDVMFNVSAAKAGYRQVVGVASWVTGPSATPTGSIWGLGNVHGTACDLWHATWPALGLPGPMVAVEGAEAPYGGSHQLCSVARVNGSAHTAPVHDARYAPQWTLMLTGEVDHVRAHAGTGVDPRLARRADTCACVR